MSLVAPAALELTHRLLSEEDGDDERDNQNESRTNAKVWAVLVVLVIALELTLELFKEFSLEKVPASARVIVSHIFAELAVVGGVSLVLFMITTQSTFLEEFSVALYDDDSEEKLEIVLEEVHYALFFIVIAFWIFGFILIVFLERLKVHHAAEDLHALNAEKLVSTYEETAGTYFSRTLAASRVHYLALRMRLLEVVGLHQNFDYAKYLELQGLKMVGDIAEIKMGSWLLLLVMLLPTWLAWLMPTFYLESHSFIAVIIGSQYVFLGIFWGLASWLRWIVYQCTPPYYKIGVRNEKVVRVAREPGLVTRLAAAAAKFCRCISGEASKDNSLVMRLVGDASEEIGRAPQKVSIAAPRYLFAASSSADIREVIKHKYNVNLAPKIIEQLQGIFNNADNDNSGQIDEEEFKDLLLAEFSAAHGHWQRIRPAFLHLASNDGEVINFADFVELYVLITTSPLSSFVCPPSSTVISRKAFIFDRLPSHSTFAYFVDPCRVPVKVESDGDKFDELFRMRFTFFLGGTYYLDLTYDRVVIAVQVCVLFNVCMFAIILEFAVMHSSRDFYETGDVVAFAVIVVAGIIAFITVLVLDLLPTMVTVFSIEDNTDREIIDTISIDDRKHRLARALRVCAMIEQHGQVHKAGSVQPSTSTEELRHIPAEQLVEWERDAIMIFNVFDIDGSGGLSVNELETKLAVFTGGGLLLSREVVSGCFDISRDVITLPMFLQFLLNAQLQAARTGSSLDHFLFSLLDKENRGKISMARMQKVLHDIDPTVNEHDVNELILVADAKRSGWLTFVDLQRMCKKYGHFPTLFSDVLKAEGPNDSNNGEAKLESITILEAEQHAKTLASLLAWETDSRLGIAILDRKGRYGTRTLFTAMGGINSDGLASGKPSPKLYRDGGSILSWVDTETGLASSTFKSAQKFHLDQLIALGAAAVPSSLSSTATTSQFKQACASDPYVRSHGVQLVFKDKVLELICENKEQCDNLVHGLPVMLNKPQIALVRPEEGASLSSEPDESATKAHDMAISAIKDDDPKLLTKALETGLDVNVMTDQGKTLYDLAIDKNHQKCIDVLRNRDAKASEDMIDAATAEDEAKSSRPPMESMVRDALTLMDKQTNARAHAFGRCPHVYMALSENRISVSKRVVEFRQGTSEITRDFELVLDEIAYLINQAQDIFKDWRIPPVKVVSIFLVVAFLGLIVPMFHSYVFWLVLPLLTVDRGSHKWRFEPR